MKTKKNPWVAVPTYFVVLLSAKIVVGLKSACSWVVNNINLDNWNKVVEIAKADADDSLA